MNRKKFIGIALATTVAAAGSYYLLSDKSNFVREDIQRDPLTKVTFFRDEREILYLASLAPSGHNTQPWFVKYLEPYHWIIGNDKSNWLPGVDPTQRETILSIGAFIQNLEFAANAFGYTCQFEVLANTNQDEQIAVVKLTRAFTTKDLHLPQIKLRRTVRSGYLQDTLKKEDVNYLINDETDVLHYLPNNTRESIYVNEQTIEANRIQSYDNVAQKELADWIRFSSKDAEKYDDGLTMASMELPGLQAWVLRNFYGKADVMKNSFREKNIDSVKEQVARSAGWLVITSSDNSVKTLIETGRRLQRLLLKIRERNIAIHPMTQILEEPLTHQTLQSSIGISDNIQFLLRIGYITTYPEPVSLRRPVEWFVRV